MTTTLAQDPADVTAALAQLLPELAVTLYESAPHDEADIEATAQRLTGRQMRAVVFLAHRGSATMGEFADGLEIGRAAASELVDRLQDKGVVTREHDATDRRRIHVWLAGAADERASGILSTWRRDLDATFAEYPDLDPQRLVAFLRAVITRMKERSTT